MRLVVFSSQKWALKMVQTACFFRKLISWFELEILLTRVFSHPVVAVASNQTQSSRNACIAKGSSTLSICNDSDLCFIDDKKHEPRWMWWFVSYWPLHEPNRTPPHPFTMIKHVKASCFVWVVKTANACIPYEYDWCPIICPPAICFGSLRRKEAAYPLW